MARRAFETCLGVLVVVALVALELQVKNDALVAAQCEKARPPDGYPDRPAERQRVDVRAVVSSCSHGRAVATASCPSSRRPGPTQTQTQTGHYDRRMLSIFFPRASSSTSLSM